MNTHTGLFDSLDSRIQSYSALPGNEALLARTGSYSTLLRGGVLGKYRRDEAEEALKTDRLDVLMLGSNPNAGPHQTAVVQADYGTLADQIKTGMAGEQKWDSQRRVRPGWNFLIESNEGWKYFRSLLNDATSLDRVGMCNLMPWGSKDLPDLVGAVDGHVLREALRFSEDLNAILTTALRPKVIVVPSSLTSSGDLNRLYRSAYAAAAEKAAKTTVRLSNKNFYFRIGEMSFDGFTATTIHLAHPAYFVRVGASDRELVRSAIVPQLRQALAAS